ncbi:ComEA family DNA-binding protein [Desulfuromonas thiophila]|uniref:ComEA protein n=1 Tax=Desulfuromonas thiophila TaxID=57664 RepID=A0A1G6YYP6_9BACT|nr:helix-hairpin-helix domain-containing protein [Desulfuromonas thiophila]SDD95441.1 comEA protein [Desulfuromonas thiophila]
MVKPLYRRLTVLLLVLLLSAPLTLWATVPVNINSATIVQLQEIKGIGEKTAEKIVAYREQHGAFTSVDQLCQVQGIGAKSLEKIAPQVCLQ